MAIAVPKARTTAVQERRMTLLEQACSAQSFQQDLATVLGSPDAAGSFLVEVFNQARTVPALHRCTIDSIYFHLLRVAQLHLNPALPNEVFFIPRNQKQSNGQYAMELTVQYGYGGLRKLVMRTPGVLDCFTREVCINDRFVPPESPISLPRHQHPGAFEPRGRVIGYYAAVQLASGNWRTVLMSVTDVQSHADRYAKNDKGKFGPAWQGGKRPDLNDGLCTFDKQALKTCLRMLCNARDLTLTAELQEALALEPISETNAEQQGYLRDGTRPARPSLTMGTGTTMEDLRQDLGGASDKEAIAAQIHAATRSARHADMPSSGAPLDPIWQDMEQLYAQAGRAEHYPEFCVWVCKRYRVTRLEEIAGEDLEDIADRVHMALDPLILERKTAGAHEDAPHEDISDQDATADVSAWEIPDEIPPIGDGETGPSWGPESPDLAKEEEDAARLVED